MVEKLFITFIGLVGLFFILMYPERVVEFLQLFVDAAFKVAKALSGLDVHDNAVKGK
jgi:hypothetical protein